MMVEIKKSFALILGVIFFIIGLYLNFQHNFYVDIKITAGFYVLAVLMVVVYFIMMYIENERRFKGLEDRIKELEKKQ